MKNFNVKISTYSPEDKYLITIDDFTVTANGRDKAREMGLKKFFNKHKSESPDCIREVKVEQVKDD